MGAWTGRAAAAADDTGGRASGRPGLLLRAAPALLALLGLAALPGAARQPPPRYEYRAEHDPDGTGRFYMGREIAQVMGHQAADWLERPERAQEERPDLLMAALKLRPGMVTADVGAGTGYFTFRMAQEVTPRGRVLAVDIQREMLEILQRRMRERGVTNVVSVLGTVTDPRLPAGAVDLILMVDVYHEFSHPWEMTTAMLRGLKPGGRLVFVEYRREDPTVPIKLVHRMSEAQVKKEMAIHPLRWIETVRTLPRQHVIVFRKEGPPGRAAEGPLFPFLSSLPVRPPGAPGSGNSPS